MEKQVFIFYSAGRRTQMLPYLVVDAILILLYLLEEYGAVACDKFRCIAKFKGLLEKKELYGYASVGIIGLFMGLRGSFTEDYSSYCDIFLDTIPNSFWEVLTGNAYQEKGFLLLNKVVGCFTSNPNVFLFLEAFLFVTLIMLVGMKLTDHVMMFALLFVNAGIYFHSFNMVRQALAAAIAFVAIEALIEKKFIWFILLTVVAVSMHTTSVAVLVLWPIMVQKVNFKNIVRTVLLTAIVYLSMDKIIALVKHFRYSDYSYGLEGGTINAFIFQLAICVFTWFICWKGLINVQERKYQILLNCSLLYFMFSVLMLSVFQMSRITYFFSAPMLVLDCEAVYRVQGKYRILVQGGLIVLLVLYMYVWLSGTGYEPYWTFLQQ